MGFQLRLRDGGWCTHSGHLCSKVPLLPPPRHHRPFPNLSPEPSRRLPGLPRGLGASELSSVLAVLSGLADALSSCPSAPASPTRPALLSGHESGGQRCPAQAPGRGTQCRPTSKAACVGTDWVVQLPSVKDHSTRTRTGRGTTCAQEGEPTTCPQVPPQGRTQSSWEATSRGDL